MRKALAVALVMGITSLTPGARVQANTGNPVVATTAQYQESSYSVLFSPDQLDNLLAPIALYPDPLLAQVLPASTFVDQIDEAGRWLRAYNDPNGIDDMPWDVSVKAVAHYPSVLYMMSDKIDWTTSLGQAYIDQSTDVIASIQRLRALAYSAGNLISNRQQQVISQGSYIQIDPIQPQYIYVPVYDPSVVYYRGGYGYGNGFGQSLISFGAGLAIGAWLNDDFDWGGRRVYYHGWQGGGWVGRSRPDIRINNVYVNNNYRNIQVNRRVIENNVNYNNLNRYNSIHREVNYNDVAQNNRGNRSNPGNQRNRGNDQTPPNQGNPGNQADRGNVQNPPNQGNPGNQGNRGNVQNPPNQGNPDNQGNRGNVQAPPNQGNPGNRGNVQAPPNQGNFGNQGNRGNQGNPVVGNKVINRNVNTNDPRLDIFRGRQPVTDQARPSATTQTRPATPPETQPQTPRSEAPPMTRPPVSPPVRPAVLPVQRPESRPTSLPAAPPVYQQPTRQVERAPSPVFGGNRTVFDPRVTSQRGQDSRASASQSRAAAPAAPNQSNTRNQSRPPNPPEKRSSQPPPRNRP
jgi:hypothetical protein